MADNDMYEDNNNNTNNNNINNNNTSNNNNLFNNNPATNQPTTVGDMAPNQLLNMIQNAIKSQVQQVMTEFDQKLVPLQGRVNEHDQHIANISKHIEEMEKDLKKVKDAQEVQGRGRGGTRNENVLHVMGWRVANDGMPYHPGQHDNIPDLFWELVADIGKGSKANEFIIYTKDPYNYWHAGWVLAK